MPSEEYILHHDGWKDSCAMNLWISIRDLNCIKIKCNVDEQWILKNAQEMKKRQRYEE